MLQLGLRSHMDKLFGCLQEQPGIRDAGTMWFAADSDTKFGARWLQEWRTGTNPILTKAPQGVNFDHDYDFAVISPSGGRAPRVCEQLFRPGKKFACLVPSDVVSWIPYSNYQGRDQKIYDLLQNSYKMVFLDSGLTWVVHGLESCTAKYEVFSTVVMNARNNNVESKSDTSENKTMNDDFKMEQRRTPWQGKNVLLENTTAKLEIL